MEEKKELVVIEPMIPDEEARVIAKWLPAVGASKAQVAKVLGVSITELKDKYWDSFASGRVIGLGRVANRVYDSALNDDTATGLKAAMFLLQTQANWSITEKKEITGADGDAILIAVDAPRQESMDEYLERKGVELALDGNDEPKRIEED
jgi:hypothetical protein